MGYIGNQNKLVSSSYLWTQIQNLYTKIKRLIANKSDIGHTHTEYLPVAGGMITGELQIQGYTNGNYNGLLVGDDCYIGDCNIFNTIALMGTSDNNQAYLRFGKNGGTIGFNSGYGDISGINIALPSYVLIKNNGNANHEGGEISLQNSDSSYWSIDSNSNNLRIFDSQGNINFMCYYNSPSSSFFTGSASMLNGWTVTNNNSLGLKLMYAGTSGMTQRATSLASGHIYLQYE